jgi:molybdopterin-guanine dinucleotide biosynthesis protein B
MKIVGLVGWSGSGKTTLLVGLLPRLRDRGVSVSTVKHAHHGFDLDRPGKDSFRHREAGAQEVLLMSDTRWALLHEVQGPQPRLEDLLRRLEPVDLVIVEGFKSHPHPKIEVYRPALGKPPIWPDRPDIRAVATDAPLATDRPVLDLNNPDAITDWLMAVLVRCGTEAS